MMLLCLLCEACLIIAEKLQGWFRDIGKEIDNLDHEQATISGRKIVHLIKALEEVQGKFCQVFNTTY